MPRVSVIIPSYNGSGWIAESIESVLNQTFRDHEIIVVVDGSTDGTEEVVARFGSDVRCVVQENGGPARARNTGLAQSRGEFVAFLDDDDLWEPDKLEVQVRLLDEHPELGVVFSNYRPFGDPADYTDGFSRSPVLRQLPKSEIAPAVYRLDPDHTFEGLLRDLFSWTSTLLVRSSCLQRTGPFDANLRYAAEDWQLCLRLSTECAFAFFDRCLAWRRERSGSLSKRGIDDHEAVKALQALPSLAVLSTRRRDLVRSELGRRCFSAGYQAFRAGDARDSRRYFALAARQAVLRPRPELRQGARAAAYCAATWLPPALIDWIRARRGSSDAESRQTPSRPKD